MATKINIHHQIIYAFIRETHPEYWTTVRKNPYKRHFKKGQSIRGKDVSLYIVDSNNKKIRYHLSATSDLTYETIGSIVFVDGTVLGFRRDMS